MRKSFIITFPIVFIICGVYFYFLTYMSNQNLYFTTLLLQDAGHILVPSNSILSSMLNSEVVLYGSFFLTFTAGLVISIVIAFFVSFFFITRESFLKLIEIFLPMTISIILVVTTLFIFDKDQLFSRVRDSFLFSNTFGQSINEFYYKYNLYAAEALNTPIKKQIKPCWIDPKIKEKNKIKKTLFRYGWLTTKKMTSNELVIRKNFQAGLDFVYKNKQLFRVDTDEFLTNPERYLHIYSSTLDSHQFLRILYSIGLLPGLPIIVFFVLHFLIFLLFLSTNSVRRSNFIASTLAGFLLIGLLFYLNPEIIKKPDQASVKNMLFSSEDSARIQGLRLIYLKNYNIPSFDHIVSQLIRGDATEKYWLANVLGMTKTKENINILRTLIKDKDMRVRYSAIRALSTIDNSKKSLRLFKQIINNSNSKNNPNSDYWYVQHHAYNAYRTWIIKNTNK